MVYRDNLAWCGGGELPPKLRGFKKVEKPGFADPAARDFRIVDDSAARSIGFVPFSIEGCGRRPPRRFTLSAPPTPPVFFAAPEKPNLPVDEGFERLPVGATCPYWTVFPKDAAKLMSVTDKTAATGSRSLEVVDSLATWTPHMFIDVSRVRPGLQRMSFALKVEPGAQPDFEVREEWGRWQAAPGPKINVSADGWLMARGRRLVRVPQNEWFRVELSFELGKARREHSYTVTVALPGEEKPRVFAGNPMHKDFHADRWLGFQSLAGGGVKYWIDDLKLTP